MDIKQLIAQLREQGIQDERVLQAMLEVPRHLFVGQDMQDYAYVDEALPIDCEQTISQPYIVAEMTAALLENTKLQKVLEIGTGSGYQTAMLAQLVDHVYSVERFDYLCQQALYHLEKLEIDNISILHADGYQGWEEHAPYDGIMITAAVADLPMQLLNQLADGGRMVVPIGRPESGQQLCAITRRGDDFHKEELDAVVFVPMLPGLA